MVITTAFTKQVASIAAAAVAVSLLVAAAPSHADEPHAELAAQLKAAAASKIVVLNEAGLARFSETSSQGATRATAKIRAGQIRALQAPVISALKRDGISTKEWRLVRAYKYVPAIAVPGNAQALRTIAKLPGVTAIDSNGIRHPSLDRSASQVGADQFRTRTYEGGNAAVAVLDTGVQSNHGIFSIKYQRLLAEGCFSVLNGFAGETFGMGCPSGDGEYPGAGAPCPLYSDQFPDNCSHGTGVAGIATGHGLPTDGRNFVGIAPNSSLVSVSVCNTVNLFALLGGALSTTCYDSDVIAGIDFVAGLQARGVGLPIAAINLSLGGGKFRGDCTNYLRAYSAAISTARSLGISAVAASGNEGYVNDIAAPACVKSVIAVGAVDREDHVAYFSNRATELDIWAPGVEITTAADGHTGDLKRTYTTSGTSFAAPHVTGALASLRGIPGLPNSISWREQAVTTSSVQVRERGAPRPRLNLPDAVRYLRDTNPLRARPDGLEAARP